MPGKAHDFLIRPPQPGRSGDSARPQRMSPIAGRVDASRSDRALHRLGQSLAGNGTALHNIASLHTAEKRTFPIAPERQPIPEHPDRIGTRALASPHTKDPAPTLLVAFRVAKQNSEATALEAHIGQLQPAQLSPPERGGKAENDDRTIPRAKRSPSLTPPCHANQIRSTKGSLANRPLPPLTPHSPDNITGSNGDRGIESTTAMIMSNRRNVAFSRGDLPKPLGEHPRSVSIHVR